MSLTSNQGKTENWSSRLNFLLASIGFSVGLGNIWRFPYVAGENGGAAFILVYLACAICIGVPLVMSEWAIGRRSKSASSASGSFKQIALESGLSPKWSMLGSAAIVAVFMLMLTYTVITGWTMDYFTMAVMDEFSDINADSSKGLFDNLMADPLRLIFWHSVVIAVIILVNARGLKTGIERAVRILMPGLFICLFVLVIYSVLVGDMKGAIEFLLTPDFSQITAETFLLAMGQAFFSIGIAMAVMVTYGSYLDNKTSIAPNAFIVVLADTSVALLAGIAIFPLVFAHDLTPDAGPGLVFQVLPIAFSDLPGGQYFSAIFFLLLIAAAFTSCIGNFEPTVAWTKDRLKCNRKTAAIVSGGTMWLVGILSILSLNVLKDFHPFEFISGLSEKNIFDSFDYLSSSILMPAGGLLTAIFVGWCVPAKIMQSELRLKGYKFKIWQILLRFIIPAAIAFVFVSGIVA